MKKVTLLLFILSAAICVNAQSRDSAQLGKLFLDAVKEGNFEQVKSLTATAEVMRSLFPGATKEKTDEEIRKATVNDPVLKLHFDDILTAAKMRHINRHLLVFESVLIANPLGGNTGPFTISIVYKYDNNRAELVITGVKSNDQWYMLEILTSKTAFREFIEEE